MLTEALDALCSLDKKVILTVSPVPIQTTFSDVDCVVANEFSKAVLRVCAERLSRQMKNVDYFPSYEMARVAGLTAYCEDNVHVLDSVVSTITRNMIDVYQS